MIQRIQSIYLFLGVIGLGLLFLSSFNFAVTNAEISSNPMLADADFDIDDHVALLCLTVGGLSILFISIFLFKNRKLQSNLVKLGLFLIIVIVGFAGFQFGSLQYVAESANATLSPSFGWLSVVLPFIFGILALRAIGKDEKLVKSMDRLR